MRFLYPEFFYLFLFFPILFWIRSQRKKKKIFLFSNTELLFELKKERAVLEAISELFKFLCLVLLVFAAARLVESKDIDFYSQRSALDILFTVDISTSMNEPEVTTDNLQFNVPSAAYSPTKITIAQQALLGLLDITEKERVGMIVFSNYAYTILPLSFDHQPLRYYASLLPDYPGSIEDGTAVWDSLMVSAERLKSAQSKSRIIVLITDGANNVGLFTPDKVFTALQDAEIRLYTVQMGDYLGLAKSIRDEIEHLKRICENTNGVFFSFTEEKNISKIASTIAKLERNLVDQQENVRYYNDFYLYFLVIALVLLSLALNIDFVYKKGVVV